MTTVEPTKTEIPDQLDPRIPLRILEEGYGPGAWHGPDLKAALADVGPALAFWRPSPERHNIAEIVLHHAYCVRAVRSQLSGKAAEAFVLEGEDWFSLPDASRLGWAAILATLESEQRLLAETVRHPGGSSAAERFDLALGITCHAVYHAGQIQLLKRIRGG